MQQTPNYALKKIDLTDSPPDITVINPNWDKIDQTLKALQDAINSGATDEELSLLRQDLAAHLADKLNPHGVTKSQVGLGNVDNIKQIPATEKGAANGVATLGEDQKIPVGQFPELSVLGAGKTASGSYVGDGKNNRFIDVGFTPSMVICTGFTSPSNAASSPRHMYFHVGYERGFYYFNGGTVSNGSFEVSKAKNGISGNGFYVSDTTQLPTNTTGYLYEWVAIA